MFAVKVKMSEDPEMWVYVVDGNKTSPKIRTFSSREEAEQAAEGWKLSGMEQNVQIVDFLP